MVFYCACIMQYCSVVFPRSGRTLVDGHIGSAAIDCGVTRLIDGPTAENHAYNFYSRLFIEVGRRPEHAVDPKRAFSCCCDLRAGLKVKYAIEITEAGEILVDHTVSLHIVKSGQS